MAMSDHASEHTGEGEYSVHAHDYRSFLRVLGWTVAGVAFVLILLAIFFG